MYILCVFSTVSNALRTIPRIAFHEWRVILPRSGCLRGIESPFRCGDMTVSFLNTVKMSLCTVLQYFQHFLLDCKTFSSIYLYRFLIKCYKWIYNMVVDAYIVPSAYLYILRIIKLLSLSGFQPVSIVLHLFTVLSCYVGLDCIGCDTLNK